MSKRKNDIFAFIFVIAASAFVIQIASAFDVEKREAKTDEHVKEIAYRPDPTEEPEEDSRITVKLQKVYPYVSFDDVDLLARAMEAENGNNTDEALILTGVVILKRVKSKAFPDSIKKVLKSGAYETWNKGIIQDIEPSTRSLELAEELLTYDLQKDYPDNLVYQAEFRQGSKVYRKINGEYFCLE